MLIKDRTWPKGQNVRRPNDECEEGSIELFQECLVLVLSKI